MKTADQLAQHSSQISRLEQAMTALAEAQVKTEDETAEMKREMRRAFTLLAKAQQKTEAALAALAEAQAQTTRQFQAYLNSERTEQQV